MKTKELKRVLKKKLAKSKPLRAVLSTGSTLVNLAYANSPYGGILRGKYYLLVGDSTAGKTVLSLTCLAEASKSRRFKDYRLIYDNAEDGALMNMEDYFGLRLVERLEPPAVDGDDNPIYSTTVEEFYDNIDDAIRTAYDGGRPFIYVLDSENALSSEAEQKKHSEQRSARRKGAQETGSYGDAKAKYHSQHLRSVCAHLRDTGSILIILSQTRDNIGFGFETKTRSGGRALKFWASIEAWMSVKKKLRVTVKGKSRNVGNIATVRVKKNRIYGHQGEVSVPIYDSFGIDDVGSCVDYLVEEGHWKKKAGSIVAGDLNYTGKRESIIRHIEENNLERKVSGLVGDVWHAIQEACRVQRKKRY